MGRGSGWGEARATEAPVTKLVGRGSCPRSGTLGGARARNSDRSFVTGATGRTSLDPRALWTGASPQPEPRSHEPSWAHTHEPRPPVSPRSRRQLTRDSRCCCIIIIMAQQPPANSAAAVPIVPIVQPQPLQPPLHPPSPLSAFYPPYYNSHQAGNGGGGGQLDPHLNLANDLRLVYQHNSYTDRLARATRNVYDQVRTSSSCVL